VSRIHEFQSHAFSALIYKGNIRWSWSCYQKAWEGFWPRNGGVQKRG
jgi:hypothetical protein